MIDVGIAWTAEKLMKIRGKAWSIRPGEPPPGEYIGSLYYLGKEYQYFQDSAGGYWYRRFPEYDPEKNK